VTITDKALILGVFLIGLAVCPGTGDGSARPDVKVSANGNQPYRLLATGVANTTVIEQQDGLMVIDDSRAPQTGGRSVARIKAFSDKPVKFLVYRHDDGDRTAQDSAFRQAWPDIVIVSTEEPAAGTTGDIGAILAVGEEYGRAGLARLALTESLVSAWREIAGAAQSVANLFNGLLRLRLTARFAASETMPCHGAG
jgi:hypothetical protein